MVINEPITVELSAGGAPVRFTWRGVVYGVVSAPEPWVGRRDWWSLTQRAPRGAGQHLLECEMWRVDAVPLTAGPVVDGSYDLAKIPGPGETHSWLLASASSDELDERLFA